MIEIVVMPLWNMMSVTVTRSQSYLTGVRVSSDGKMIVTVVSVSRVWSISGRRMVMGGDVLAVMR